MQDKAVFKSGLLPWLLLLPSLLVLIVFIYFPAIQAFILSLYRSNLRLGTRQFIGFDNFTSLFVGPFSGAYKQIMLQSFLFSFCVVVVGLALSVVLATYASQKVRGARIYRLFLIWPFALSPAVAATIFVFLFNPQVGGVNLVLNDLFGIKPRWFDTPTLAFILVVAAAVWKNLGYNIVFYLAALQNIPKELGEAASIDGAGPVQQFFRITLPMLSPMTFFLVFTNLTFSFFDAFGIIDILTRGGPIGRPPLDDAGVTTIMMYRVFQEGIEQGRSGFAAAFSIFILGIVALITLLQFRYGSRNVQYGDG